MKFEEKFGVKVDVEIPQAERDWLYGRWEEILSGESYKTADESNFKTRYEHMLDGSSAGMPPDPFKILKAFGRESELERIVKRRRSIFPDGEETKIIFGPRLLPKFEELTGLNPFYCMVGYQNPSVSDDGRVQIPRVVAFYGLYGKKLNLSDHVIAQLQFPTEKITKLSSGLPVKEIFDFKGGYRLEYVK